MDTVTTLPISPIYFWTAFALLGILTVSALIYWALSGIGRDRPPPIWENLHDRWAGPTIFLGLVWLGLFTLTIIAAYVGVWQAIYAKGEAGQPNLGLGALLAALLGAPFVIWGTWLKYQTVRFQKEGHMTDRISKAVEQLGAEKKVDRIGRSVTIWTGKPVRISYPEERIFEFMEKPRTKIGSPERHTHYNHETDDALEGNWCDVVSWPDERTVIEWQNQPVLPEKTEALGAVGSWTVYSESVPNIEVRIGAILSLERIAQDSTSHDRGRDHVRVMEILCAYARENAKAASLEPQPDDAPAPEPRLDLQLLVDTLKRRSFEQLQIEAGAKYRLDLRGVDFGGVNFSKGNMSGAILANCRFEFSNFEDADLRGALFYGSLINYAWWRGADITGVTFDKCTLNRPIPSHGRMVWRTPALAEARGVSVVSADLTAMDYFGENPDSYFGSSDTKLTFTQDELRKNAVTEDREMSRLHRLSDTIAVNDISNKLKNNPFRDWAPYDGNDLAIGHLRSKWRDRLGLTSWPYVG